MFQADSACRKLNNSWNYSFLLAKKYRTCALDREYSQQLECAPLGALTSLTHLVINTEIISIVDPEFKIAVPLAGEL